MAQITRRWFWLIVIAAVALSTQGCREDEQGRVLIHEPGVYQGQPDESLDEARVDELRYRARQQKF